MCTDGSPPSPSRNLADAYARREACRRPPCAGPGGAPGLQTLPRPRLAGMRQLKVDREQARFELDIAAQEGMQLLEDAASIRNEANYEGWKRSRSRWTARTSDALEHVYHGDGAAKEFAWSVQSMVGHRTWQQNLDQDYKGIQDGINALLSLTERLRYDAEPDPDGHAARLPRVARLEVSRAEAEGILAKHVNEGETLLSEAASDDTVLITEEENYRTWRQDQKRWNERTRAALRHVYGDSEAAEEFYRAAEPPSYVGGFSTWPQNFESNYSDVGNGVNVLVSLSERLQYDDEPAASTPAPTPARSKNPVVFIVHGHDTGFREKVARWLEKEGPNELEVVILDEQPDKGRTVLEKLEDHASESLYAVVLFTGDDVGAVKSSTDMKPRARQNVVFEFGWFCGLIGRENVGVIHAPDVELPSDLSGLVYIPQSEWEKKLRRELTASGLEF